MRLACTLGLAAAASALYLLTMPGGVGGDVDAARWQFMGKVWGVSEAPGYPLYLLLNHLFSILPFGALAWRINLLSVVFAVLSVVLVQRILAGLLRSEALACGGAALLAVSQIFWVFAVVAEVNSLNAFFVCLIIYLLFKWSDVPAILPQAARRGDGYFYAACVVYALSLGNQLAMITMLPAIVLLVLMKDHRILLRGRTLVVLFSCAGVAAALYSLLFLFTSLPSAYLGKRIETPGDLWTFVAGADFWQSMFAGGVTGVLRAPLSAYMNLFSLQFSVLGFVLIAVGFFLLASNYRLKLWFLLVYLAVDLFVALDRCTPSMPYQSVLSFVAYEVVPSYIVLVLIMGLSMGLFRLAARTGREAQWVGSAVCMLVMAATVANLLFVNIDVMKDRQQGAEASNAFANDVIDALPYGGVILANEYSDTSLFLYKMLGEGYARDKEWRVLQNTLWKHKKSDTGGIDPANDAAKYDVSGVARLVDGEEIDWGPLALKDANRGRHEIFFIHRDKTLMDMAGFVSEPVDLKGDSGGRNRYGVATVRLYRITSTASRRPAEEIIRTYDRGLALLRKGKVEDAKQVFESLLEYNPNFAEAQFQVGMCYRGMRNYDEARKKWKLVLDLVPGYSPALDALGTLPLPKGQAIADAGNHSVE